MGMGRLDIELLIRLRNEGHFHGARRVVEIGAQQAANGLLAGRAALAERLSESFNVLASGWPLPGPLPACFNADGTEAQAPEAPPTRPFWQWLGFDYAAIDVDGSPGAVPLDLNYDTIPFEYRHQFCLVTNYGTTEHVCNQLNAFKIIHDLAAVDGVMVHNVPAQGHFCHGLINYNMKFFWMLARSNGYEWLYSAFSQGHRVDVHDDIQRDVARFEPLLPNRDRKAFSEGGIIVAIRKKFDYEFVAPLDIPNDAKAPSEELNERYWTVFDPMRAFGSYADAS